MVKKGPNEQQTPNEGNKNNQLNDRVERSQIDFIHSKISKNNSYFENTNVRFNDYISFLNKDVGKYWDISNLFAGYNLNERKNIEAQIKALVVRELASVQQSLHVAETIFHDSYVFTREQTSKISEALGKIKQSEIKDLFDTHKARIKFLKDYKIIKKVEDLVEVEEEDFFENFNLSKKDIQKAKNNGIDLFAVQNFLLDIYTPDFEKHIKDFFSLCNEQQKKQFLQTYVKTIPVSVLEKIGLIDESQIKAIILRSIPSGLNFSSDEIDDIISKIDKKNFFLPLQLDQISSEDFNKLIKSKEFLGHFDEKFSKVKESYKNREEITNKLDEAKKDDYPNVLKSFIYENRDIHPDIKKSFQKAKNGLFIQTWNESKQMHDYVKIINLNAGTIAESANIVLQDCTHLGKIRPNKPGPNKSVSYIELIATLEALSKNIAKNNNSNLSTSDFFDVIDLEDENNQDIDTVDELNNITSKQECKDYLDEIDKKNSGVPIDKTSFVIGAGEFKGTSFYVEFSDSKIPPVKLETGERVSYSDFILKFKELECERFETIKSPEDLLKNLQEGGHEVSGNYKGLKLKNGKIVKEKKVDGKTADIEYNYFISEVSSSDKSIYSPNLKSSTYFTGKYTKTTQNERDKGKKDDFKAKNKGNYKSYNDMYQHIIQNGLVPHSAGDYAIDKQDDVEDFEQKGSFVKRFLKGASIGELIGAFKIGIDAVSQKFETGTKLKSAKLAMKIASVTGKENDLYTSMQQVVEAENKKQVEEIMTQLKNTDSDVMLKKIVSIIQNRDSEEYEKEAALMTIVSKYGTLYPKNYGKLRDRRNEWIWYRAFGGKVNDKLFQDTKADCEGSGDRTNPPTPFTEEVLMEKLLKEQKKAPYNRRSKLHKDYGGAINGGIRDEQEDGANKTSDMATLEGKIDYIIGNMRGGEVVNSSGALDNLINHNGDHIKTAKVPFVFTITNMAKDLNQGVLKKSFINRGFATPYTSFLFNMSPDSRETYYDTVKLIIEDLGDGAMADRFKKIIKNSSNQGVDIAAKFWDDYGAKLLPILNCQDGFILSKVKKNLDENHADYKKQEVYKNYYSFLVEMTNDTEYSIEKDMINDGRFDSEKLNTAFVGVERMCETQFKVHTDGKIDTLSQRLFSQSLKTLEKVLQNPNLSREEKKANYLRIFTPLWATAHEAYGNNSKCGFLNTLKFYGFNVVNNLNFNKDSPAVVNDPMYNKPISGEFKRLKAQYLETKAYKNFCEESTDNFFNEHVDSQGYIISQEQKDENELFAACDDVKVKISHNLDQDRNPANDSEYHQQNVA